MLPFFNSGISASSWSFVALRVSATLIAAAAALAFVRVIVLLSARSKVFEAQIHADESGVLKLLWSAHYRFRWMAAAAARAHLANYESYGTEYSQFPVYASVRQVQSTLTYAGH